MSASVQSGQSRQHLLAAYGVTSILNESKTLEQIAPRVLGVIAESLDWDVGIFWKRDDEILKSEAVWASPQANASAFVEASRLMTFHIGQGIPGQVWQTRQMQSSADIQEDQRYLRGRSATSTGLRGAVLFPIFCADELHGVLELVSRQHRKPDADLLHTMTSIGFQIGQFLERSRTEAELRRERDNLRQLFEYTPAAFAVIRGDDFRYELSNPMNRNLSGGRALVGKTIHDALPELEAQGLSTLFRQVFATGTPFVGREVPASILQPDGSTREMYLNGVYHPLFDTDGKVTSIVSFAYEVTEQVQARVRAEQAERSTALIADAVPQIIWTMTPTGQIDFFNRRWYEYTGFTPNSSDADAWSRACHPDDLPSLVEKWRPCAETVQPFEGEVRMLRGSDRTYRWHLARSIPLKNAQGNLLKWIGSSTDIHDHKEAEARTKFISEATTLLAGSLDYQETLRHLTSLVVPQLADWCAVYWQEVNETQPKVLIISHADPTKLKLVEQAHVYPTLSRGPSTVIRTGVPELVSEVSETDLIGSVKDAHQFCRLREIGFSSVITVPLTVRGKTFGAMSFAGSASRNRYTEVDLMLARELAERAAIAVDNARLYQGAQQAVKVRDEFLSIASHELRTPLTPLQVNVQSIQRALRHGKGEPINIDKFNDMLNTIGRQVGRLERLVDSLLDVSRITGDRLVLDCEQVDLVATCAEVIERFTAQAAQSGTTFVTQSTGEGTGWWDRLRVDQVVVNLVSNALKFGAGKPVEVSVIGDATQVTLVVKDHGIGIAQEDQERIFGRFERAVPSKHYGGLGLGLWLSRQLVEAMHGSIAVQSVPAAGSTFTVTLPRGAPPNNEGNSRS